MPAAPKFRAALVQLRSGREIGPNMAIATDLIRAAAADGARYVQTPENTPLMETVTERLFERIRPEAETAVLGEFAELARELGIWLHVGSVAIRVGERKAANRAFVFAPSGAIAARYDKIHMFDVDLPSGESYRESKNYQPGATAVNVRLPWGVLGVTTCYDLRFPEHYKALAQAGADFLTAPSAFTKVTGEAHWHVLLRARAIETGCYMLAAAQGGAHENGRSTYGHSLILSPWGDILAEAGEEPGIIAAEIDPAEVLAARQRIPALDHVRPFELATFEPDAAKAPAESPA
ncbi:MULTISPECIES: carbon-nitrogen hydrolase family protein [Rhodomicrobium]|uniref:carbon-nitrogen hydrolase family protein n=1 Tax=Rhodomicrobium TaxID=1068 RepID=UPI000B4B15B3|nr:MULTISPECIES: carbon-nitrogen hydrolase family protein [Rhodomicrobium]